MKRFFIICSQNRIENRLTNFGKYVKITIGIRFFYSTIKIIYKNFKLKYYIRTKFMLKIYIWVLFNGICKNNGDN